MSCPICSAESRLDYRPFCSKRCADLDLAKWLNGSYACPARIRKTLKRRWKRQNGQAPKRKNPHH